MMPDMWRWEGIRQEPGPYMDDVSTVQDESCRSGRETHAKAELAAP